MRDTERRSCEDSASCFVLNPGALARSLEWDIVLGIELADERDHWKIHFRDTMRGGKFLNDWRMAELHAKLAPERVRLLEEWGAVFDRTKKGLINQRIRKGQCPGDRIQGT